MENWIPFLKSADSRRLAIDLGIMDHLQFAQHQQWHELFITGPTQSIVGTNGNDFPGLYYYDPRDQFEHVLMFSGTIDWHTCKLNRRIEKGSDGELHLFVGLFSEKKLSDSIKILHSKNKRSFISGQQVGNRDAMPNQWEALEVLNKESFRLLPLPKADKAYNWGLAAEQCLTTLKSKSFEKEIANKKLWFFFQSFESDSSTYKTIPKDEYGGTAELICQVGLASSLLNYSNKEIANSHAYYELGLKLAKTLSNFYDPETGFFLNTYPPKGEEWKRAVIDTWYAFHNLYHVIKVALLSDNEHLKKLSHKAVKRIILFVQACNYQIPLFAKIRKASDLDTERDASVIGFAINPSVLGMYARILVEAAEAFPENSDTYKEEAVKSLFLLRQCPWNQMYHQTVQLSWAAWAAHCLGKRQWRNDFINSLLLYCYRQGQHTGLFQGCAGLNYPTFRETVEAVSPWVEWIGNNNDSPLHDILNLVLNKAQYFLSKNPHAGLPQEGLATNEQPKAGDIGIAIYASPQVFDLAVLQKKLTDYDL